MTAIEDFRCHCYEGLTSFLPLPHPTRIRSSSETLVRNLCRSEMKLCHSNKTLPFQIRLCHSESGEARRGTCFWRAAKWFAEELGFGLRSALSESIRPCSRQTLAPEA